MSEQPTGPRDPASDYECVEQALGDRLWRLDLPDLAAEERARLEGHVAVCDACRLRLAVQGRVADGLRGETLTLEPQGRGVRLRQLLEVLSPRRRPAWARAAAAGGVLAWAGAVALLVLPPRAPDAARVERSAAEPVRFERPIEGEVLGDRTPALVWSVVEGATGYRITLREIDGDYIWRGQSDAARLELPEEAALPEGGRFRAAVEPIPADLAPLGALSVSFRVADPWEVLRFRWSAAAGILTVLAAAGGVLLLVSFLLGRAASATRRA